MGILEEAGFHVMIIIIIIACSVCAIIGSERNENGKRRWKREKEKEKEDEKKNKKKIYG